jgi:hypothetical protein
MSMILFADGGGSWSWPFPALSFLRFVDLVQERVENGLKLLGNWAG